MGTYIVSYEFELITPLSSGSCGTTRILKMGLAFKLDSPVEKCPLFISTDFKEEEETLTQDGENGRRRSQETLLYGFC
jgi:hypothetical protein